VWRHARELALGFYYVWDPWPPREWLEARAVWAAFVREEIKHGTLDSELDVALAYPNAPEYLQWVAIRDTFKPNKRAVWICDSIVNAAAEWMDRHPHGIVWSEHIAFGERLEQVSRRPYFGRKGQDRSGRPIESATGPVVASKHANKKGRNLQHEWFDNLITSCPSDGAELEQLLGRTHRDGQLADTVTADIYFGCIEHVGAFWTARDRARYIEDTSGNEQKLCYADLTLPTLAEFVNRPGPRWQK
jgi:hypothetical protein